MEKAEKVKNIDLITIWGFIFFILGALGIIQMGFLEGHSNYISSGILLILIGIVILISAAVIDKFKS